MAPSLLLLGPKDLCRRFLSDVAGNEGPFRQPCPTQLSLSRGETVRLVTFDPYLSECTALSRLLSPSEPVFSLVVFDPGHTPGAFRDCEGLSDEACAALSRGDLANDSVLEEHARRWTACIDAARSCWPKDFECSEVSAAVLAYSDPALTEVHWTELPRPLSEFVGADMPLREFIVNDAARVAELIDLFPWSGESTAAFSELRDAVAAARESESDESDKPRGEGEDDSPETGSDSGSSSVLGTSSDDIDETQAMRMMERIVRAPRQLEDLPFPERARRAADIILSLESAMH